MNGGMFAVATVILARIAVAQSITRWAQATRAWMSQQFKLPSNKGRSSRSRNFNALPWLILETRSGGPNQKKASRKKSPFVSINAEEPDWGAFGGVENEATG